jgi:hypothetical protein
LTFAPLFSDWAGMLEVRRDLRGHDICIVLMPFGRITARFTRS